MLDELASKMRKVVVRGKRIKTLSELMPVKNIRNLQSFLEISPVQKEVLPSNKLQGHVHE